jgi:hypothetical protein
MSNLEKILLVVTALSLIVALVSLGGWMKAIRSLKRLSGENGRLNGLIQEKVIPALQDATMANNASTAVLASFRNVPGGWKDKGSGDTLP